MSFEKSLDRVLARHKELLSLMGSDIARDTEDFVGLSRELSELSPVVEEIELLQSVRLELKGLEELITDAESDSELRELAEIEHRNLQKKIPSLQKKVELALIPREKVDTKNAILEIMNNCKSLILLPSGQFLR